MDEVTEAVVEGLATHKLVPFFGAGVSIGQLKVDWKAIANEMADRIALPAELRSDYLSVAQRFYDALGANAFAEFLRAHLIRSEFDEVAAWPHIFLISLNAGLLYTTNQDNLFELASEKYGRPHRVIAEVGDLAEAAPRDNLLIKYHGDLTRPDTIIFTETSYRSRMENKRHFLNIRLQSDLLSKGLLFIGYSFSDPNVRLLFQELRQAFGGDLPKSYLIAYHYDAALEDFNRDFGVEIIDPRRYVEDAESDGEAFSRYLGTISEEVHGRKHRNEVEEIFTPSVPRSIRIATVYELDAVIRATKDQPLNESLPLYRNTLDRTFTPGPLADKAQLAFENLCSKAENDDDLDNLHYAMFNMTLPAVNTMEAVMHLALAINRCSRREGFQRPLLVCPQYPSVVILAGVTQAMAYMRENYMKVTDQFRQQAEYAASAFATAPDELKDGIRALYQWAWSDKRSPLPRHVLDDRGAFAVPRFEVFQEQFQALLPKN